METIRNYLENMFLNLPRTSAVMKAKMELGQMMEDKYNELIASGKSDNEAVGIVISEFGNLQELAEDLGIYEYVKPKQIKPEKMLTMEQVKQYISDRISASVKIAIAVFLCIASPTLVIFANMAGSAANMNEDVAMAIGIFLFFLFLIIAIGIFIFTGISNKRWDYIKYEPLQMDFSTESFIRQQMENYRALYAILIAVGVILCVASVVPAAVIGTLDSGNEFMDNLSGALVLFIVAIGVMFLIIAGVRQRAYELLLHLNGHQRSYYRGKTRMERKIKSVYWPTIVCIYLMISFLSFHWEFTWIIWPIAAVLSRIISITCGDDEDFDDRGGR